jgi:hypothetical protein
MEMRLRQRCGTDATGQETAAAWIAKGKKLAGISEAYCAELRIRHFEFAFSRPHHAAEPI